VQWENPTYPICSMMLRDSGQRQPGKDVIGAAAYDVFVKGFQGANVPKALLPLEKSAEAREGAAGPSE